MDTSIKLNKNLTDPNSMVFKILIISIILFVLIYFYIRRYRKYNKLNPTFFETSITGKKIKVINSSKFPESNAGDELTYHFWLYVDNIIYNYGKLKNVFTKGSEGFMSKNQCPGIYISPKTNNLNIVISTSTKNDYFKLENFPIRKWFSIAIIIKGAQVDFYRDGLLEFSKNLSGIVKTNKGNMYLAQNGGFDGMISCIQYFPEAKTPSIINYKHKKGPSCINIFKKMYNKISGKSKKCGAYSMKTNTKLKKDIDKPKYTIKKNYMCNGILIKDLDTKSMKEAQKLCNDDPDCGCITKINKNTDSFTKGHLRLVNNMTNENKTIKQSNYDAYVSNDINFNYIFNK